MSKLRPTLTILSTMPSAEEFFEHYWGRKPLLVRGALSVPSPLSPDALAGLALEDDVPSRMILWDPGKDHWHVTHGPFLEEELTQFPQMNGSLLVNDTDKFIPECAALWDMVWPVPPWRRDDIMVNFSSDGGNVGPHLDRFDVFLFQADGRKSWRIGKTPLLNPVTRPDEDLAILETFPDADSFTAEAGDLLYLPPYIPHHGVSIGKSTTISFGFRAPCLADIMEEAIKISQDQTMVTDSSCFSPTDSSVSVPSHQVEAMVGHMRQWTPSPEVLAQAYGCVLSRSDRLDVTESTQDLSMDARILRRAIANQKLFRHEPVRCLMVAAGNHGDSFFCGGKHIPFTPQQQPIVQAIATAKPFSPLSFSFEDEDLPWIQSLFERGALIIDG